MSFHKSNVSTTSFETQKSAGLMFHSNPKCWTQGTFVANVLEDSSGES